MYMAYQESGNKAENKTKQKTKKEQNKQTNKKIGFLPLYFSASV